MACSTPSIIQKNLTNTRGKWQHIANTLRKCSQHCEKIFEIFAHWQNWHFPVSRFWFWSKLGPKLSKIIIVCLFGCLELLRTLSKTTFPRLFPGFTIMGHIVNTLDFGGLTRWTPWHFCWHLASTPGISPNTLETPSKIWTLRGTERGSAKVEWGLSRTSNN